MFTIRKFALRVPCDDIHALQSVLKDDFKGESVSIEFRRSTGIIHSLFVDVTEEGVVESYGQQKPVDFDKLAQHIGYDNELS